MPTTGLVAIPPSAAAGTTVRFSVDPDLVPAGMVGPDQVRDPAAAFSWLSIDISAG